MRLLVIGGGASGMIAALTAAERPDVQVTLLERQARVGRKLAATGNGRCNLSNGHLRQEAYHGGDPAFAFPALRQFGTAETLRYFEGLGLLTVTEESGRVYPFSDQAGSVVDVLRLALEQSPVNLVLGAEVTALFRQEDAFFAETAERRYAADRVIVACGGMAGGKLGGTQSGYQLLQSFGHRCSRLYPSLVQLKTDPTWVRSLKGIRAQCAVAVVQKQNTLAENTGEVQFTEYGLSGPCIFELSRAVSTTPGEKTAVLDLLPQCGEADLSALLRQKREKFPALTAENLLTGILQNRLGRTVVRSCGVSFETKLSALKPADLTRIAQTVKRFSIPINGVTGMEQAQVTAGGIVTDGFDPETMESRLCPGLYACGEVLDIDGDCGGYNLQWAWASGRLAGEMKGRNT